MVVKIGRQNGRALGRIYAFLYGVSLIIGGQSSNFCLIKYPFHRKIIESQSEQMKRDMILYGSVEVGCTKPY